MADANSAYTLADAEHLQAARRVLPDDDRAAAGARRHHRPRRAAGASCKRPSAWTNASAPRTMPSRPSSCAPAASSISSWDAWAASPKPSACTMWRRPPAFRCGAAACWKPASGARTTSRWPPCPISCCRATCPPASATGSATSSCRRWKPRRTAPSPSATNRASATRSTCDYIREHHRARGDRRLTPFVSLLRDNRNYRYTWIGQVVSEIGDHFNNIAVFSLAVAHTRQRLVVSGVIAGARHPRDARRAAGGRAAGPPRPQARDDRERPDPRASWPPGSSSP